MTQPEPWVDVYKALSSVYERSSLLIILHLLIILSYKMKKTISPQPENLKSLQDFYSSQI